MQVDIGGAVPWWKVPAVKVVQALKHGRVTPLQLIDVAERRIAATDKVINACPTLCFERAREAARQMELKGHPQDPGQGYLYGLPVVIKDTQAVSGVLFTEGSPIYAERVADWDDPLVEALERQGGIVMAKTNAPEFAAGSNTYNPVFGRTVNPWDTTKTSGGSSGGSAAAVACGQAWLASGSDLGGSCRIPGSFCGVVGMRPSPGLVPSQAGSVPIQGLGGSRLFSVNGPLARSVADAALMMDAMVPGNSATARLEDFYLQTGSYSAAVRAALQHGTLARDIWPAPHVAFSESLGCEVPMDDEVVAVCRRSTNCFVELGAQSVEEADSLLADMMEGAEGVFKTLRADLFAPMAPLMDTHRSQLKPELIWNITEGLNQSTAEVKEAAAAQSKLESSFTALFDRFCVVCLPAVMVPPFDVNTDWVKSMHTSACGGARRTFDNYTQWLAATSVITLTNCPAISVPCGFTSQGLPVGLQIVARPGADAYLLAVAALLESKLPFVDMVPLDPQA